MLEAVTGHCCNLGHRASGFRKHGDGRASQIMKVQIGNAGGYRSLIPVLVEVSLRPSAAGWCGQDQRAAPLHAIENSTQRDGAAN